MLARYQKLLRDFRIGNTDLVELPAPGLDNHIYAKLEYQNVTGSHYDRVYLALLNDLESRGQIRPGVTTLVETTSGNAGISCAFMARELGYGCKIFLPASLPTSRKQAVASYGADVCEVEGSNYIADAKDAMATFLVSHRERVDGLRVYYSPNHSQVDISCEAVEPIATEALQEVLDGFTCFVGAAGNGTTLKGIGRVLRQRNPSIWLGTFDPTAAMVAYQLKYGAVPQHHPHAHAMLGAGAWGVEFPHLREAVTKLYDDVLVINEERVERAERDLQDLGYDVGPTSAASYDIARQFCAMRVNERVLIVFYDQKANRY